MAKLYNLARMTTATAGTGTVTLGGAVSGYLTFANAGVQNGDIVWYGIKDTSNSEVGYGTYTSAGTTLTRNVYKSTNGNALISLSGSAEVYITALAGDGGDIIPGASNPYYGFDAPINLQLNASVSSNILTIAVKGNNGSDPSKTNPVLIPFRDATIANGDPSWVVTEAALSIDTNAVGATLGTANSVPFRLWVLAFNNSGTAVLALFQTVTGGSTPTALAALDETGIQSTTPISGTATSAGVFYTPNGTTLTNKAFRIIGFVDYASGLATAGTYASAPTTVQLFGPGVKKPGDRVKISLVRKIDTFTSTTTGTATDITGMSVSINPSSAPNLVRVGVVLNFDTSNTAAGVCVQLLRGSTNVGGGTAVGSRTSSIFTNLRNTDNNSSQCATTDFWDAPGTTSSTTYKLQFILQSDTFYVNRLGTGDNDVNWNGRTSSSIVLEEIMV